MDDVFSLYQYEQNSKDEQVEVREYFQKCRPALKTFLMDFGYIHTEDEQTDEKANSCPSIHDVCVLFIGGLMFIASVTSFMTF